MAEGFKGLLWAAFWILVLIFVSFFVAYFCAFWYVIVYAFEACIPGLKVASDLLLKGVQFPHLCVDSAVHMKSYSEACSDPDSILPQVDLSQATPTASVGKGQKS